MPEAVFTNNLRVEFVKGWLTGGTDPADGSVECGDGTAYPIKVTVDQLSEIFYRVRDTKFISGALDYTGSTGISFQLGDGPPAASGSITYADWPVPGSSPPISQIRGMECEHGCFIKLGGSETAGELAAMDQFFSATYTVPPSTDPTPLLGGDYRESLDLERAIWFTKDSQPKSPTFGVNHMVGGYDVAGNWGTPPSQVYGFILAGELRAHAVFSVSGRVALVGGSHLLDQAAELWMEAAFEVGSFDGFAGTYDPGAFVIMGDSGTGGFLNADMFELELSGGVLLKCGMWFGDLITTTTPFRLKATEWWPYQAGNPPANVWNPATGLRL